MKAGTFLCLVVLIAACLAAVLPARTEELLRRGQRAAWNTNYYDPAWGMPEAVVVPPTVRWQSNYAWGVGGSRVNRVGADIRPKSPGRSRPITSATICPLRRNPATRNDSA